jgi:mRNA-degrading endonuclease toxin of MazEF toxin-antitoxin module
MVSYPGGTKWLITLDPSKGSEIKKTRPCLVISPDEMNEPLHTAWWRRCDNPPQLPLRA